ncbi:MAG: tetratricopeptide repeat protein [Alphaproteobacteria bacterium]
MNKPIVSPLPLPTIQQAAQSLAAGRLDEAARIAESLVRLQPDNFDALHLLGVTRAVRGRLPEALKHYEAALKLRPGHPDVTAKCATVHLSLAHAFLAAGATAETIAHCRSAERLAPERGEHLAPLASALILQRDYVQADKILAAIIARAPNDYNAHLQRGILAILFGTFDAAIVFLGKALALNGRAFAPLLHLAEAYRFAGKLAEAIEAARAAAKLAPDNPNVLAQLAYAQLRACDWRGLDPLMQQLDDATAKRLASNGEPPHPAFLSVILTQNPSRNLAVARANAERFVRQAAAQRARLAFAHQPLASGRIRIGYLSSDFKEHPTAQLMTRLFELHDRDYFRIYAYSYGPDDGGTYRRRIATAADRFVELGNGSDVEAAKQIHADGTDILVDLNGWLSGGRLGISALRPAPIQVSYLGFPGTTGADFIDYILVDKVIGSAAQSLCLSEAPVYLPDTYQATDDLQPIASLPVSRAQAGLPREGFVFACFNNSYKIEPVMFDAWMRILKCAPESVLWLLATHDAAVRNLREAAVARGVDPQRLVFAPIEPRDRHLARLRLADLALDTRICNGHTTTTDALWAGVPVLTLIGSHFASRVAASLLKAVGLPDLVKDSLPAYEAAAVDLARDPAAAAALRARLAVNRTTTPLFDSERFTRNLEAAYEEMMRLYRAGDQPQAIDLAAPAKR